MRKSTLSLAVLTLACCCHFDAIAQYDSSRLDAGYLQLKKEFTQTISIKGADLEKMPFANLSDAIGVWLYGAYTMSASVLYVVDGNPVTDVNAYSIHDIEEVVLVQNGAALGGTGGGQQELVLVRTKRGKGRGGITAAGGSGLVNASGNGVSTDTRAYHDYYLGAYRNLDKISFGVSGNWLRDVLPKSDSNEKIVTPDNLSRWRLNGYFTWRPNSHNQVELSVNYSPEHLKMDLDSTGHPGSVREGDLGTQHLFMPRLRWRIDLLPGLTNELQGTYLRGTYKETDLQVSRPYAGDSLISASEYVDQQKSYHLWLRDRVAYTISAGGWRIEPAVNISYEHLNEQYAVSMINSTSYGSGFSLGGLPTITSTSDYWVGGKSTIMFLTPAVDISYKRILDIQGGVLADLSKVSFTGTRKVFPFASLSLDVLRLANVNGSSGLTIFGSYAQRTVMSTQDYGLQGLTTGTSSIMVSTSSSYVLGSTVGSQGAVYSPGVSIPAYWVWETGASYSGWKNRLLVQYNFERRNFSTTSIIALPYGAGGGSYLETFPEWKSSQHHLDVRVKVLDGQGLSWQTGVNLTLLRSKANYNYPYNILGKQTIGDESPASYSWTGGWVNRVQVKDVTAGLDLLYHFGESVITPPSYTVSNYHPLGDTIRVNSIMVPNIYIGYRWHLPHAQTLEFFLESRGLIRNSSSDLLDERRYYTVGGKLSI